MIYEPKTDSARCPVCGCLMNGGTHIPGCYVAGWGRPLSNPGWQCPRCGAGNAPWVTRCDCVPLAPPGVTC